MISRYAGLIRPPFQILFFYRLAHILPHFAIIRKPSRRARSSPHLLRPEVLALRCKWHDNQPVVELVDRVHWWWQKEPRWQVRGILIFSKLQFIVAAMIVDYLAAAALVLH